MRQRARPRERGIAARLIRNALAAAAAAVAHNPAIAGGTTAFLVALFYVSANALWYQPHSHAGPLFETRGPAAGNARPVDVEPVPRPQPAPEKRDVSREPGEEDAQPTDVAALAQTEAREDEAPKNEAPTSGDDERAAGDPTVRRVQRVLADLELYAGPVDGLAGPKTGAAIENYRRVVGIEGGDDIDDALLSHLGLRADAEGDDGADAKASGRQTPADEQTTASVPESDPEIERVQAGLRAFGNDDIELDGVMGERTEEAIREFQSLFGLEVTGKPDEALLTKMNDVGLTGEM